MESFSYNVAETFNFVLGREVKVKYRSIWRLHLGMKKKSSEKVSIFVFEASRFKTSSKALFDIAKSVVKRIKTLRHPDILRYLDSLEVDESIYLVVEPVEPLELYLLKHEKKLFALSWGLYQITSAVTFLNKDCQLTHYNVGMSSVFVDQAGEWKLFGLESITPSEDPMPIDYFINLKRFCTLTLDPAAHSSWRNVPSWVYDSWGLGYLIWQIFNEAPISQLSALQTPGKIPINLASYYLELVCVDQKSRSCSLTFLERASKGIGYFNNIFVDTMLFLREIHIKEKEEKCKFFNNLTSNLDIFPRETRLYRILPELIKAVELGNADSSAFSSIMKLGKLLSREEFKKKIVPCISKMFSSEDRTTKTELLQEVPFENDASDWDEAWQDLEPDSKHAVPN